MPRQRTRPAPEEFAEDWELLRSLRTRGTEISFVGRRDKMGRAVVKVTDGQTTRALPLARSLFKHSHGFEWGYSGSGPSQLALAILYSFLNDAEKAVRYHQKFKFMVIAGLPQEGWELPESVVREAVQRLESEESSTVKTPEDS